jgi:hypothetical protein
MPGYFFQGGKDFSRRRSMWLRRVAVSQSGSNHFAGTVRLNSRQAAYQGSRLPPQTRQPGRLAASGQSAPVKASQTAFGKKFLPSSSSWPNLRAVISL